ncbi:MAG: condensation domain-containing protein [Bryobacteraceae bacterium]|jgi:hypothetical protein
MELTFADPRLSVENLRCDRGHLDSPARVPEAEQLAITPAPRTEDPVLSFAQERIWFLCAYGTEPTAYLTPVLYRLTGPLDLRALNHSLSAIAARHEALRTVCSIADGVLRASILPPTPLEAVVHDFSQLNAADRRRSAEQTIADQEMSRLSPRRQWRYALDFTWTKRRQAAPPGNEVRPR